MGASSVGGGASGCNKARTHRAKAKIKTPADEPTVMKFGIDNSSWLDSPDPAEGFAAVEAKAQWAKIPA